MHRPNQPSPAFAPNGRALNMPAWAQMMPKLVPRDSALAGIDRVLRPSDVVITPFAKCGTTWLQQMAHALRTRGDENFDDISRVTPWIEMAGALGINLDAEQCANPRVFKSHLDAQRIPRGGKYINASRDPRDAALSFFKFMEGWTIEPGSVPIDDFVLHAFIERERSGADYWEHLSSWWERRNDADVLFLAYEQMKADLPGSIRQVAAFMDIELDEELLAITLDRASLAYMQSHGDKFDDRMTREYSVTALGVPADSDSSKVRSGQVGEARSQLGAQIIERLDEVWYQRITRRYGFADYAEMIATLRH